VWWKVGVEHTVLRNGPHSFLQQGIIWKPKEWQIIAIQHQPHIIQLLQYKGREGKKENRRYEIVVLTTTKALTIITPQTPLLLVEHFMDFGEPQYWNRFYERFLLGPRREEQEGTALQEAAADLELEPYDWYFDAETLLPLLLERLPPCPPPHGHHQPDATVPPLLPPPTQQPPPPKEKLLMLGCGSSRLSELLYAAGHRNIINVDFAPRVIDSMRRRTRDSCPELRWLVLDVTCMREIASDRYAGFFLLLLLHVHG